MLDAIHDRNSGPLLMGILNRTPDSFSDGGLLYDVQNPDNLRPAISLAERMLAEGAKILDIGGESTRPGAADVSEEEEARRVLPLVRELAALDNCWLSIDTQRSSIARAAVSAGALLVNDISAGSRDQTMFKFLADNQLPCVLMHMQGRPADMQDNPQYENLLQEVAGLLAARTRMLVDRGLPSRSILLDPGIGFGKTLEHNLQLLASLDKLANDQQAILLGVSRKSFIARQEEKDKRLPSNSDERLGGSIAAALVAAESGVGVLRVHDVKQTRQALDIQAAIKRKRSELVV
jgi:dihydropteroate synthase